MITVEVAIRIHRVLIEEFGGTTGIRDKRLLESALLRPFQTFDKKDLYPSPSEKASAIIESIITNHPFLDGNKRLGYVIMRLTLLEYGFDIQATENEKFEFVICIAKGEYKYNEILKWVLDKQIEKFN